jgi:4-hydroxy-tetrahydrodipicolinate synthase
MIFKGVCTALVTPMTEQGIDYDKMAELIDWQIAEGVDAILLSGTTGEAPTISDAEKKELFHKGAQMINHRVPFIAGTGTNSTSHIIELCGYASVAGAEAFLLNNPYYNKSSNEGIIANYQAISDRVDKPIIVYNVPSRTGKNIDTELALELCKIKHIAAFKEASGNISQIGALLAKKPDDITVYSGNDDQTLPIMALGGMGVICTTSNIAPKLCCDITDAFFAGDLETARKKQHEMQDLFEAIFIDCNPIPLKTAMNMVGMNVGIMRLPLVPLTGAKKEKLAHVLEQYGYTVSA